MHTTSGYNTWTSPYVLPHPGANNLDLDDISTLVANRANNQIGVLWSNQNDATLYYATHADSADFQTWDITELCKETFCPDDHLNIKDLEADPSGRVFAAVKTSKNDAPNKNPTDPLIVMYTITKAAHPRPTFRGTPCGRSPTTSHGRSSFSIRATPTRTLSVRRRAAAAARSI